MTNDQHLLDDLHNLTQQLSRQAFSQPPVEGWLNSFMASLCQRFQGVGVRGAQVMQLIGNIALQIAAGGKVPEGSKESPVDAASPISLALQERQVKSMGEARFYPLLIGNDGIGVLIIHTDAPSIGVEVLDKLFGMLSTQLAPALAQNVRTPGPRTGKLMHQIDIMRSLYELTRDFSEALESKEILQRAAKSLVETLRIDHVGIVTINRNEQLGTVIAEYPDNGVVGTRLHLANVVQQRLLETKVPVVIDNVDESEDLGTDRALFQKYGVKSVALLPMIVNGEVIGSVGLDAYYDYHAFTTEEIEAAAAVTSQLAISANNAHLYEELKRRAFQLERITEMSRKVTSTFDRARIFQTAREETERLLETHMVVVALRPPDSNTLALHMLVDGGPVTSEFPIDRTGLRFIFSATEPLVIDDISGADFPDYQMLAASQMRAIGVVPLVAGGRVNGAFCVLHRDPGHYMGIDLAVLEQIGNQIAVALENARLYSETSQRADTERLMNELGSSIQGYGDLKTILLDTMEQIALALGAKKARVRLEIPSKTSSSVGMDTMAKLVNKFGGGGRQ
jgi:GAF domain-containing protein